MAIGFSEITLVGYVGNIEPISTASDGINGAKFSLAINREWINALGERREAVDWFNVVVWREQLVESVLNHLGKGRLTLISGRPIMRQWEDESGKNRERLEVVAQHVIFLDKKPSEN